MKVISFALFKACEEWEFNYYLRGLYWNARMARLVYPGWKVCVYVAEDVYAHNYKLLTDLGYHFGLSFTVMKAGPLCEMMLWRMLPIWSKECTHFITRDLDSILTQREANFVAQWLFAGHTCCGINDNPAHRGTDLMGGLSGFKTDYKPWGNEWATFIGNTDLSVKGSDQAVIGRNYAAAPRLMYHWPPEKNVYFSGNIEAVKVASAPYWQSNLIPAFMGSAGINEMEALRFFNSFDLKEEFNLLERKYPNLFYWRL